MKKQAVIIGSVVVAVCLFMFPSSAYAATNSYNTSTVSGSVNDVSYYVTVNDGRSAITSVDVVEDTTANSPKYYYVTYNVENVAHFSFTLRNRDSTNYKVMDTNNFIIVFAAPQSSVMSTASSPHLIMNTDNVDVWQMTLNSTSQSGNAIQMQIRYTGDPYLTPDEQIYFSFDLVWESSVMLRQKAADMQSYLINIAGSFPTEIIANVVNSTSLGSVQIPTFTTKDADSFMESNSSGILGKLWQQIHQVVQAVRDNGVDTSDQSYRDESSAVNGAANAEQVKINSQHTAEQSRFSEAQQALSDSGFNSFHFDTNQLYGIMGITDLFSQLWTALGPLTGIITFTMILRLAVTILRHKPAGGNDDD